MKENPTRIITPDGKVTFAKPANGRNFSLKEAQAIVGGNIEIVSIYAGHPMILVVDEDGIANDKKFNPTASRIFGGPIYGTVLYCEKNQIH